MLYKTIASFVPSLAKRIITYQYDEELLRKFEIKVKESWLHNPLLYYVYNHWFEFLSTTLKISLYGPGGFRIRNDSIYKWQKRVTFVLETPVDDIDNYLYNNQELLKLQYNYPPELMYLYLEDKLEPYVKRYIEWSKSNNRLFGTEKSYFKDIMDLQNSRSGGKA